MENLGSPLEIDRLAFQIESLRDEISYLESHAADIKRVQSFTTKDLAKFKTGFRNEASKQAQVLRGELERLGTLRMTPPPKLKTKQEHISGRKFQGGRGGEWDSYSYLSQAEKSRLRRNWTNETGVTPDQMTLMMEEAGSPVGSSDEAFEIFLNHTRQIDLLEYYAKTGRMPKNYSGYGGKSLDSSFITSATGLDIDLRAIHDSNATPTQQLNYLKEQMIGSLENEVDSQLPNGLRPIGEAFSEKLKLEKEHKMHLDAMNKHLSERTAEVTQQPLTSVQRKQKIIQRAKETALNDAARREAKKASPVKAGKPSSISKKVKPSPAEPVIDNAKDMVYDDSYFDSLVESEGGYIHSASEEMIGAFEELSTVRPKISSTATASISSSKKAAVEVAEETAARVVRIAESSRADKALSKLVSKGGEFGPEALRLGALATTLGLGAGYAAGRRHRRR